MLNIDQLVLAVRDALQASNQRLVLAESCTAGRVAASLAVVPGISAWLCGSFVVYRNDSKAQWLSIPLALLNDPQVGPVSHQVTELLCKQALNITPEADLAAAVTGHIGPGCPPELDGKVFVCLAERGASKLVAVQTQLRSPAPLSEKDLSRRLARLEEATQFVLANIQSFAAHS